MTRMLWKFLLALTMTSVIGGCSLFSGDDSGVPADFETESVSGGVVLDTEDEMLEESANLVAGAEEDFGGDGFGEAEAVSDEVSLEPDSALTTQEALDNEFEAAELGGGDEFAEEGFADDDLGGEEFSDEGMEISGTNSDQVDQGLASGELGEDPFSEFDEEQPLQDEFALETQPIEDEFTDAAIVDVPQDASSMANQVTNLEYKSFENGGTVVIETSSPAQFEKIVDPELNQLVIQVNDVFLPERFKRPYVTKDFKQDIATINAYSDVTGSARFVIQLKRPIDPSVQQAGNSILVMTATGVPMQQAAADPLADPGPAEQPLDQLVADNEMQIQTEADPLNAEFGQSPARQTIQGGMTSAQSSQGSSLDSSFGGVEKSGLSLGAGTFSGEKINLEFVDQDVRTIIEVIADRSGVNLIMDKEVDGKTSIKLRDVPWDQALQVLLRSQGLGYVKQGSVLRISKQSTLSKEAQAVSEQIQSEKKAQLLSGGIKVKYIPVSYAKVSELAKKLKDFTSKEGKVASDDRTSSLVITDYGEYIDRIADLVKALDTAPMQVEIESKLIEARETFIRESGINWDIAGQAFPFGDQSATVNAGLGGNLNTNGFSLDLNIGTFDIFGELTAALSVFESNDKIKVLSQPRIVTMNKVPAEIRQTLQVPFQKSVIPVAGPPIITFELLDVILSLKVTPQITFKGDVILEVEVQRDFAGAQNQDGSRELNKRFAKSTVMVKNGKTAVIGGIYQLDDGDIERGIPILKDIPLLGNLFRQNRDEKIKSELLLFLKPKILREIDGPLVSKAATPGANYDPFEELSLDEGNRSESLDQPVQQEDSSEFEGEGGGSFDADDSFEDELDSLSF